MVVLVQLEPVQPGATPTIKLGVESADTENMQEHVLVVEDAPEFQHLHRESLSKAGYRVSVAETGARALEMARSVDPAVIILDLVLPDVDGMDLCAEFRRFTDAYIIMVTSRSDEVDKLVGLAAGADDYMTKPFSNRELVARVGVLLRRPRDLGSSEATARELGDLVVDPAAREVSLDGEPCSLTKIEFDILDALTEDTNLVRSRQSLIEHVWGPNWVGDTHVIDVHLANLRKKIDCNGTKHIKTVRGVGYRYNTNATEAQAAA